MADYLLNHGFKGRRNSHDACPVAIYLRKKLGVEDVEVDGEEVVIYAEGCDYPVSLPMPVRTFVDLFDSGHYPSLAMADTNAKEIP